MTMGKSKDGSNRGQNENSRAALATGKQITKETASKYGKRSQASQKETRLTRAWLLELLKQPVDVTDDEGNMDVRERAARVAEALVRKAEDGDTKAAELILKVTGDMEETLNVKGDVPGILIQFANKHKADEND